MQVAGEKKPFWEHVPERVLDRISPEPEPPASPPPPPVDQTAWERSVDHHKVNTLTVHDAGLIVFNETQPFSDTDSANESIDAAREKVAHAVINGDEKLGLKRPRTALPIEPSRRALQNPQVHAAYESSLKAAREAYLSPSDPTDGASYFNFRDNSSRANYKVSGTPIRTQSGPFGNSFPTKGLPSRGIYVNTYAPD
jgi:hypothetical protein